MDFINNTIIFLQIELEGSINSNSEMIKINDLTEEKDSEESEDLDDKNGVNDDAESCCSDTKGTKTPQVIEMNVTIGNMDTNPLFNTLLDNNDDQVEENNSVQNEGEKDCQRNGDNQRSTKGKTLNSTEKSSEGKTKARENDEDFSESQPQNESPFMTEISTKRRKVS